MIGRLKKRREYLAVAATEKRFVTPSMVLQYRVNPDEQAPALVGFTVTKKMGNAVARNRIRRRLKEVARLVMPEMARAGHEYVVVGRQNAKELPFPALIKEFKFALGRVNNGVSATPRPDGYKGKKRKIK